MITSEEKDFILNYYSNRSFFMNLNMWYINSDNELIIKLKSWVDDVYPSEFEINTHLKMNSDSPNIMIAYRKNINDILNFEEGVLYSFLTKYPDEKTIGTDFLIASSSVSKYHKYIYNVQYSLNDYYENHLSSIFALCDYELKEKCTIVKNGKIHSIKRIKGLNITGSRIVMVELDDGTYSNIKFNELPVNDFVECVSNTFDITDIGYRPINRIVNTFSLQTAYVITFLVCVLALYSIIF